MKKKERRGDRDEKKYKNPMEIITIIWMDNGYPGRRASQLRSRAASTHCNHQGLSCYPSSWAVLYPVLDFKKCHFCNDRSRDWSSPCQWIAHGLSPSKATTYIITVTGPGGTATASVTVTFLKPTVRISANPSSIEKGKSTALSWTSTNALSASINQGIGVAPPNDSVTVSPSTTTAYTITVTGPGGTATASVTVTVIMPKPTVQISADPSNIDVGQSATLSWSSTNATSAVINPGFGNVPVNGSVTVFPIQTTTYTITATGAAGTTTASASVTIAVNGTPDAFEGFGGNVTGCTGGAVYWVTTLKDSGAGSLREAVKVSNRIIRFSVSGTITLASVLSIQTSSLTIDGFSAPSPGITITGMPVEIAGGSSGPTQQGSNIIIQGLRFRGSKDDNLRVSRNAHDIVIDHCSFSGAMDGACDITEGAFNVTFSWNIIAKTAGEGKAQLIKYETSHVSVHHNIYYSNEQRNPQLTGSKRAGSNGPAPGTPIADVRYNIIWEFGVADGGYGTLVRGMEGRIGSANVVSNLYTATTNPKPYHHILFIQEPGETTLVNAKGNISVSDCRGTQTHVPYLEITSANSMSNHAEFTAPEISGPAPDDQAGRLAEWLEVKKDAGLISKFADDATDAEARGAILIPELSIFSEPWNVEN